MRLRLFAADFCSGTSIQMVYFSTHIKYYSSPRGILEVLFCFLYTDLLATFSQMPLSQLLLQNVRKFLVCLSLFAKMAGSILAQKVKIRFCSQAG